MSEESEPRTSQPQEPVVPPQGCRARGETEPLAVPQAAPATCSTCRFGEAYGENGMYVACRRYAPRPVRDPDGSLDCTFVGWPQMLEEEWCGEWQSKDTGERLD